jgi:peptidoglycan hydrolase CwlO-like protein
MKDIDHQIVIDVMADKIDELQDKIDVLTERIELYKRMIKKQNSHLHLLLDIVRLDNKR